VAEFLQERIKEGAVSVVGYGVDHDTLVESVESAFAGFESIGTGVNTVPASVFHAGDVRVAHGGSDQYLAIAVDSSTNVHAGRVLAELLNADPSVAWGNSHGVFGPYISKHNVHASAVSLNYSDAALVAVVFKGKDAHAVRSMVKESFKDVFSKIARSGEGIADADWTRAVNRARMNLVLERETRDGRMKAWEAQMGMGGSVVNLGEGLAGIEQVTKQQVVDVVKKALSGHVATAAVGNTRVLPYAQDL
jgi:predicted Zn-dependent peptidase